MSHAKWVQTQSSGQRASVAAVVLTYEAAPVIAATLSALTASDVPPDHIIVVDNASAYSTATVAAAAVDHVQVLVRDANDGYGRAMNVGAERARVHEPDYLLFVTQECRLAPEATRLLLDVVESRPDLVAVGPLLLLGSQPDRIWSAGGRLAGLASRPSHVTHIHSPVQVVEWLDGAALLVRTKDFVAVDGFCEDYFLYWEDVDLCLRLRERGTLACVTDAHAWQDTSLTPPYLATRNRLLYLLRTTRLGLVAGLVETTARIVWYLVHGRTRRAWLTLAGAADGFTGRLRRALALERPS
jgi:GT2 family glycosyltransferase